MCCNSGRVIQTHKDHRRTTTLVLVENPAPEEDNPPDLALIIGAAAGGCCCCWLLLLLLLLCHRSKKDKEELYTGEITMSPYEGDVELSNLARSSLPGETINSPKGVWPFMYFVGVRMTSILRSATAKFCCNFLLVVKSCVLHMRVLL